MKLSDIRLSSWKKICRQIASGEHPEKQWLSAALRRGDAVPVEAQQYIADLLEGRARKRGRPRNGASDKFRAAQQQKFDLLVFELEVEKRVALGVPENEAVEQVIEEFASARNIRPATLKRRLMPKRQKK